MIALPVKRSAKLIVKKVMQPDDTVPSRFNQVEVCKFPLQRVGAFDAQYAAENCLASFAVRQQSIKIGAGANDPECVGQGRFDLMQTLRLIKRALEQAVPRTERPKLPDRQCGDVVEGVGRVVVVILPGGGFGNSGKDWQRYAAFDQPVPTDLSLIAQLAEIPVTEHGVGAVT